MTRDQMIDTMAIATGLPKTHARLALDNLLQDIATAVVDGAEVTLPGIGRLSRAATKAATGRNPRTGEPIDIPAGYRVKFSPSAPMKRRLATVSRTPAQRAAE